MLVPTFHPAPSWHLSRSPCAGGGAWGWWAGPGAGGQGLGYKELPFCWPPSVTCLRWHDSKTKRWKIGKLEILSSLMSQRRKLRLKQRQ